MKRLKRTAGPSTIENELKMLQEVRGGCDDDGGGDDDDDDEGDDDS